MTATSDVLHDDLAALFRPTLADLRALSTELGSAIGAGKEWVRLDGDTFVSASRDGGKVAIVGTCGGWRSIRAAEGRPVVSEPHLSAVEAVMTVEGP
jgi:hypothetical protein